MTLRLRYSVRSHVGKVRDGNEDSAYAGSRLALVADGMGGHAAGEVASSAVVATLAQLDEDEAGLDLLELLASAVQTANDHLREMVDDDASLDGMGTTLTALLSSGTRLGIAHIGDSRAYLLRDGEFSQLTHDQTLVQRMVDEGRITAEQAETHPQRSLLTQALDGRAGVEPDLSVREARRGDRYLLCSDGLSGFVPPETIAETLQIPDADEAAEKLIDLALRAGAPDNVTVVVADVVDDEAGLPDTPVVGGAAAEQKAVPTAAAAVVLPGGASLSPDERAAKRASGRRVPSRKSPGSQPGSTEASDAPPQLADDPADTGVFRRPPPPDDVLETPPDGMPPVGPPPPGPPTHRRRGGRRPWYRRPLPLALIAIGVVIVAAILITWSIVANSWYVARAGDNVALYHGIQSQPLGVSLSSVEERGTPLSQLTPVDREQVRSGIVANSRADGVCILARLKFKAEDAAHSAAVQAANQQRQRSTATTSPKPPASPSKNETKQNNPPGATAGSHIGATAASSGASPSPTPRPSSTPRPSPSPSISIPPPPTPLPKSCAT